MNSIQEIKQQILNVTALHVLPYSYYQTLKKLVKKICNLLDENNIQYWCYGGAILGKARYNGLLPWDDDFDICIMDTDMEKLLDIFEKNQIKFNNKVYPLKIFDLNGVKIYNKEVYPFIDVFPMKHFTNSEKLFETIKLNDDNIIHISKCYPRIIWKYHYFTKNEIFPLKKIEFENFEVNFPNNYVNYLNRGYPNWTNEIIISNLHIKETVLETKIPHNKCLIINIDKNKINNGKYIWSFNKIFDDTIIPKIILTSQNIDKFLPNLNLIKSSLEKFNNDIKNEFIKYLALYHYGGIFTNGKNKLPSNIITILDELKTYDYINVNDEIIISRPYSNLFTIFLDDVIEKIINNQTFDIKSLFDKNLENFIKNENYTYLKLNSVD